MVEHLPTMPKSLDSIPSRKEGRGVKREKGTRRGRAVNESREIRKGKEGTKKEKK